MSRGLRNNNPENIRLSGTKYLGETASDDPAFKRFETPAWGYRAIFVLLHTYRSRHGLRTLEQMISRYAPPKENDTGAYVAFVERRAGTGREMPVDTLSRWVMIPIVAAVSRMENGVEPRIEDVEDGWELFIRHKP